MIVTLYTLNPPQQWRAGFAGSGATREPIFFDCAECGAKAPPIAGFLGTGPTFAEVASLKGDGPFLRKAMYCATCTNGLLTKLKSSATPTTGHEGDSRREHAARDGISGSYVG